jgi:hypothetical protein
VYRLDSNGYQPSAADPHEDKGDGLELPPLGGYQQLNDVLFLAARSIARRGPGVEVGEVMAVSPHRRRGTAEPAVPVVRRNGTAGRSQGAIFRPFQLGNTLRHASRQD